MTVLAKFVLNLYVYNLPVHQSHLITTVSALQAPQTTAEIFADAARVMPRRLGARVEEGEALPYARLVSIQSTYEATATGALEPPHVYRTVIGCAQQQASSLIAVDVKDDTLMPAQACSDLTTLGRPNQYRIVYGARSNRNLVDRVTYVGCKKDFGRIAFI